MKFRISNLGDFEKTKTLSIEYLGFWILISDFDISVELCRSFLPSRRIRTILDRNDKTIELIYMYQESNLKMNQTRLEEYERLSKRVLVGLANGKLTNRVKEYIQQNSNMLDYKVPKMYCLMHNRYAHFCKCKVTFYPRKNLSRKNKQYFQRLTWYVKVGRSLAYVTLISKLKDKIMHHLDWLDLVTFLKSQNLKFYQTFDQLKKTAFKQRLPKLDLAHRLKP